MARKQLKALVHELNHQTPSTDAAAPGADVDELLEARLTQARTTPPAPPAKVTNDRNQRPKPPKAPAPQKPPTPSSKNSRSKRTSVSIPASLAERIRQRANRIGQTTGATITLLLRDHADEQVWTPAQARDRELGITHDVTNTQEPRVAFPISMNANALTALDDFAAKNAITRSQAVTWLADQSTK